ncbi:MAG: precorrin-8X methylmutase [Thermosynechococcaceae cyanobacterium]
MGLHPHPILLQSFAIIDREMGPHAFTADEYAIVRRTIHSTADFAFKDLLHFSPGAIDQAIAALTEGTPIVTDVSMVTQGIVSTVQSTFQNPIVTAIAQADQPLPGCTRTETGLLDCWGRYPQAIYVIGNAPTALNALCEKIVGAAVQPTCIIGAPVGFVGVVEAKKRLAALDVPQIRIDGRKGGSAAAAAILNALLTLAWERSTVLAVQHP